MPRLRNARSGVVVNVDDETAARLGRDWRPAEKAKKARVAAAEAPDSGASVVPSGSVAEVTEWVGEDRGRAALVLQAEQDRGEKARVSLVNYLTKLLAASGAEQRDDDE